MPFATPRALDTPDGDEPTKNDLVDELIIISPLEFDAEAPTRYGVNATLLARVVVVTGPHAGRVIPRFFCAGNLARQIGHALRVGEEAPGRIRHGKTDAGREWYGIGWAADQEDQDTAMVALNVLTSKDTPRATQSPSQRGGGASVTAEPAIPGKWDVTGEAPF